MIGFKIDFLLILGGFWEGFGRVWETKLDQKSIKNRYGKMMEYVIDFSNIEKIDKTVPLGGWS